MKGQRFTTQMNAFLTDGKWITDKNYIRDMWVNHFEDLRKPSVSPCFDHEFSDRVATRVRNISASYQNELPGTLNEPLQYQEVFNVCFKLKSGVFGVLIDYEHIRFGGPILWKLLHDLYQVFFDKSSVCKTLKTGLVLPLFKGKGTKANNKDNYRGIILFPTLCKIYEMIILNRSEKFASHVGYFSEMQLGFHEGSGCIEASFTILETINHMLESGSKMFSCFLDVRKAFDTVWIDGLMYKLFSNLGVNGKLWLAIKDLYADVKARVLYSGALSREFEIAQGTGQGRILAPFMYKVYINSLLKELFDHCFAISINTLRMPVPSFADDICLIALHQSLLKILMNKCRNYSKTWRYEFNHSKSGVVTFGETKPIHCKPMKEREWALGDDTVEELSENKNLGVLKNYCGSFASNISDNIDKTRKKAGMIFSSSVDRRKTNPLVYVKFWRQACLPSLLRLLSVCCLSLNAVSPFLCARFCPPCTPT